MELEKVRVLLAAAPDSFERVARRLEMPLPLARDVRMQAMNLVQGRCVLCGQDTLAGMCGRCRKAVPQRRMVPWRPIELLKLLNPSDQLLRQTCDRCGGYFMLSVSYLLRKLLTRPGVPSKNTCARCVRAAQEAERKAEEAKKQEEERKKQDERRKVIEERRRREIDAARARRNERLEAEKKVRHLFHNPFQGNETLADLRDKLPANPPRPRNQNRPRKRPKPENPPPFQG